jgi:hypothetical protein
MKADLWKKWGPYLSDRQWGTVREDYSENGDAWNFFTHDHARSRAYRWGEDGIGGFSDDRQYLCFALALWNGRDPILKERYFGLTNGEGNHGEDVKEYYFYLDGSPTHSYMKMLYKYPQTAYPYLDLIDGNRRRSREEMEYELLDTGVFADDRYFDIYIEYAKSSPEDILIKITAINRGSKPADLQVLPTLWFRNNWSKWIADSSRALVKPAVTQVNVSPGNSSVIARHVLLGDYILFCEGEVPLLFTENETNHEKLFPGTANESPFVKDGINDYIVDGKPSAVNPAKTGTKMAAQYQLKLDAGEQAVVRLRLTKSASGEDPFGEGFENFFALRREETEEFYQGIIPSTIDDDAARVIRQSLAGMIWTKQFFYFDVDNWLVEHNSNPLHHGYREKRNSAWFHMLNEDIISMPDKWEYPWYAAWDLAFHTIALSMVDLDFAKQQLSLMLKGSYLHPNGQMPAYEWNFSNVTPPVHAWATLFLYRSEAAERGTADHAFIRSAFDKLLLNFTWWLNQKDKHGNNVFEGGFLGLDNIGVFDRSAPLPLSGELEQADGTAWMSIFSQNMLELAIELCTTDPTYQDMVLKFAGHFSLIAAAINRTGEDGLWDEEDGFYYDLLRLPDGSTKRLKVRSIVGLLPICATTVIEKYQRDKIPDAMAQIRERLRRMPTLLETMHPTDKENWGIAERGILALVNPQRLRRILSRMLDEEEFLSPFGIRSLSKYHAEHPYILHMDGKEHRVDYIPAESNNGMFGGNSNWRGPVWMPLNVLLIQALLNFYLYYGDNFKIEFPTRSGHQMNLFEVAQRITHRLTSLFTRNADGMRPVYGATEIFQHDPHWRDHILFYEYFHGDNGAGIGASHQTGWTGAIARLIQLFATLDSKKFLADGKQGVFVRRKGVFNQLEIGEFLTQK